LKKNGGLPTGAAQVAELKSRPVTPKPINVVPPIAPREETSQIPSIKSPLGEHRRWERVSLASTRAYALIGEGVERTARVLDLSYGGVALETSRPEEIEEAFHAVLHVPILPPVRVSLRRIYHNYQGPGKSGIARIGCSFVT
jgi:hypothetical protein